MDRKQKRTVIAIDEYQPELDFDEAAHSQPFSFPEYQRDIMLPRLLAGAADFGMVAAIYLVFVMTTLAQMPEDSSMDQQVLGIYAVGFFLFVVIYFFLFMLGASQTPGMKLRHLIAVTKDGTPLDLQGASMRALGYLISIVPFMLGFVWALIDPEHLTWTDKVSGTYIKKL